MKRTVWRYVLALTWTLGLPVSALAGDLPVGLNLGLGLLMPGEVNVDVSPPNIPVDTQAALMLKAGVDVPVIPLWWVSGRVMYANVAVQDREQLVASLPTWFQDQIPTQVSGFQVEAGPKVGVELNESLTLKFALYGGYRAISGDTEFSNSQGFALDGAAELHIRLGEGWSQYWEIGFLSQPYGGREGDYYLVFGPLLYLLAGVAY
ncbi:MAG: hypothetical protein AB1439_07545 [candidate division FCPU426 bacterium]